MTGGTFVFDAGPLSHFARTGQLAALHMICAEVRRAVTVAVLDELAAGVMDHPALQDVIDAAWLEHVRVDSLADLAVFAEYARVLGSSLEGDVGEAATLAWAETHNAVAIIDDQAARNVARQRQVRFHGSLWLITQGMNDGHLREIEATQLVGMLLDTDARFPFSSAAEFIPWARAESLLD